MGKYINGKNDGNEYEQNKKENKLNPLFSGSIRKWRRVSLDKMVKGVERRLQWEGHKRTQQ